VNDGRTTDTIDRGGTSRDARREEILAVATRLFAENGYANTTMTGIAKACGLRQPSLYYWFTRKEHILNEVLALNRVSLDFVAELGAQPGSAALRLYRLLHFDTYQLCLSPLDISEVESLAERQPEAFDAFWGDTAALHDHLIDLVRAGVAQGQFIDCDPELVALHLCSAGESIQRRHRHAPSHAPAGPSRFRHPTYPPELIASMSVRSLLRDPGELPRIRAEAMAFNDLARLSPGDAGA
jgi:AcrR family transcriptional regulator